MLVDLWEVDLRVSTHSRPKAAGLAGFLPVALQQSVFQLTAARRRLDLEFIMSKMEQIVSTHSRPKAAGYCKSTNSFKVSSFNSQPPEGGWGTYHSSA